MCGTECLSQGLLDQFQQKRHYPEIYHKMATPGTKRDMEALISGETVTHRIRQELTYRELYDSIDNLRSVLFTTGYLTQRGAEDADVYRLAIPNREIRQIFKEQIQEWFQAEARKNTPRLDAFCTAFCWIVGIGDLENIHYSRVSTCNG